MKLITKLLKEIKNKRGQGMVEYGLILAAIALIVIVAMTPVGTSVANIFNNLAQSIGGVTPAS
ncbi:MAG: Flp family type IVb pilin [Deltaproteobacteria bacterium]